jgi:hypothetical protein
MSWDSEGTKASAIIARVEGEKEATLEDVVKAANEAARGYHDSVSNVERISAILDQKLEETANEDAALDLKIMQAAGIFVGAGFTKSRKPFGSFTSYTPSKLAGLRMAREVEEVQTLVARAAEAKPPELVVGTLADLLRQSALVRTHLDGLTEPKSAFDKAIQARTEASLELKRAMRNLRLRAELAWPGDAARIKRLFAPPEDLQDSVIRKPKKSKAETPATPAES